MCDDRAEDIPSLLEFLVLIDHMCYLRWRVRLLYLFTPGEGQAREADEGGLLGLSLSLSLSLS